MSSSDIVIRIPACIVKYGAAALLTALTAIGAKQVFTALKEKKCCQKKTQK